MRTRDRSDPSVSRGALAELCRDYWYPLYAFARRLGRSPHDAEDATQEFFAHVTEENLFAAAAPELGKLRTFLLTAFTRHLGKMSVHDRAQKRGGGCEPVSLDFVAGESRYVREPADPMSPDKLFERSWARVVLHAVLARVREKETAAGRGSQFGELECFLSADPAAETGYREAARRLSLSEAAVRQAVSRLRRRFRERLRQEIADTLHDPSEAQIEEELDSLRQALCG